MSITSSFLSTMGSGMAIVNAYKGMKPVYDRAMDLKQNKLLTTSYNLTPEQRESVAARYKKTGELPEGTFLSPKSATEMKVEEKRGIKNWISNLFAAYGKPQATGPVDLGWNRVSDKELEALYKRKVQEE